MLGMNPTNSQNNGIGRNDLQFHNNLGNNNPRNFGFTTEQQRKFQSLTTNIQSSTIQKLLFNKWLDFQRLDVQNVTLDHLLRFEETQLKQWVNSQPSWFRRLSLGEQRVVHEMWKKNLEKEYAKWKLSQPQNIQSLSEEYQFPLFESWLAKQDQRVHQLSETQQEKMFSMHLHIRGNLPVTGTEQATVEIKLADDDESVPSAYQEERSIAQNTDRKRKHRAEESKDVQDIILDKKVRKDNPNVADRWYVSFEIPGDPNLEEKFFNAAEKSYEIGINKDTAKKIVDDWRKLERDIWKSFWEENNLTEEDLKKLQKFYKSGSSNYISPLYFGELKIEGLLDKIRIGRRHIYIDYSNYSEDKVRNLLYYHDFMMASKSNSNSSYRIFRYCNNNSKLRTKVNKWLTSSVFSKASEQGPLPEINSDDNRGVSQKEVSEKTLSSNTDQETDNQVLREVKKEPFSPSNQVLREVKQEPSDNQVLREVKQEPSDNQVLREVKKEPSDNQVLREVKQEPSDNQVLREVKQEPSDNQVLREVKKEPSTSSDQEQNLHNVPLYPNDDRLYKTVEILRNYKYTTENDFESVLDEEGNSLIERCDYTRHECKQIVNRIRNFYLLSRKKRDALEKAIFKRRELDASNKKIFTLDENNPEDQELLSLIYEGTRDSKINSHVAKLNKMFRSIIRTILGQDHHNIRKEEKAKTLEGVKPLARTWAILTDIERKRKTKIKTEDASTNKRFQQQNLSKSSVPPNKRIRKESSSREPTDIIDLTEENADKK